MSSDQFNILQNHTRNYECQLRPQQIGRELGNIKCVFAYICVQSLYILTKFKLITCRQYCVLMIYFLVTFLLTSSIYPHGSRAKKFYVAITLAHNNINNFKYLESTIAYNIWNFTKCTFNTQKVQIVKFSKWEPCMVWVIF